VIFAGMVRLLVVGPAGNLRTKPQRELQARSEFEGKPRNFDATIHYTYFK
jgi:putative NADH-flavin reductase